jgi:DNA-binding GntR family transcriptional regulator
VLALQVAHLMRLTARRAGLDLSVRALLAQLAGIEETVLVAMKVLRERCLIITRQGRGTFVAAAISAAGTR